MDIDTTNSLGIIIGSIMVGLLSSMHCIGMCGGISQALSYALPPKQRTGTHLLLFQLYYNFGRIFSYLILGALFGSLGLKVEQIMGQTVMNGLRVVAAIFITLLGLYILGIWKHFS